MTEQNQDSKKAEVADYTKTLGRDGSYLELDMDSLGQTLMQILKTGSEWPKQVVLKAGRFDITDPSYIEAFKNTFEWIARKGEKEGMSDKQIGFLFFKSVFDSGLRYMIRENHKPMVKYGGTKIEGEIGNIRPKDVL